MKTKEITMKNIESLKPPLKWAGGKRWQIPYLLPLYRGHEHRRLVEPFCGGLAVTLGLRPARALLNDINPHLINFYIRVQQGLCITTAMENEEAAYYRNRDRFNALATTGHFASKELAELFYYLNRTGFNGLCRFNRAGGFNVPFGTYATINYASDFLQYKAIFQRWTLTNKDFAELPFSHKDFVYADPPYDVEFTKYAKESFRWDDQVRLATQLAQHKGPVVLSNQATPRIVDLYKSLGFRLRFLKAPRMISCNGDRTPATEVLAIKNL